MPKCQYAGCSKWATFANNGETRALFCREHRCADMVNVVSKRCEHPGCTKQPTYAMPGETLRRFCTLHKSTDMVDVANKRCEHPGCMKQSVYAMPGETRGCFCATHKSADMVDVINKRCEHPGCARIPAYSLPGEARRRFCTLHKSADMINTTGKRCEHPGCMRRSYYAMPGETMGCFCASHKDIGMVDVKSKRCEHPGCTKISTYAMPGETRCCFCATHKSADMIDVKHKRCEHPGCTKVPTYAMLGETRGYFCATHKNAGMVNVISKRCSHPGCATLATYGLLFAPATHCAKHANKLIEFKDRRPHCQFEGCRERPTMTSDETNFPTHCAEHAPDGARVVEQAVCAQCHSESIVSANSRLCAVCEFGRKYKTYHKYKEEAVRDALLARGLVPNSADRVPEGANMCEVRSRPDFAFHCTYAVVILEVDENQHARAFIPNRRAHQEDRASDCAPSPTSIPIEQPANAQDDARTSTGGYSCDCEQARMIALHGVYGMPTIFIRYNPDEYIDAHGHKIRADHSRLARCIDYVARIVSRANDEPVEDGLYVAYLYYDGAQDDVGKTPRADLFEYDYVAQCIEMIDAI